MPIISNQPQQPLDPQQPVGRRERGTGFTNIGRLLGANVGAGQKMGQGIGTTLGSKAGQLKQDVSRAGEAFQQRYGESVGQAQDVFKQASGLLPSSGTAVSSNLSGMSEEQAKQLGQQLTEAKTYKGPTGLEGQEQLGSRAATIGGMGQLAGAGSYGQGLLLGGVAGKAKPYTRGQTALDTFLLGQSKEGQKSIREGAAQTYGAQQQAESTISGASQQAKEAGGILGKQQADIKKRIAESGEQIRKTGTEQAKQFLGEADRLKTLLADPTKLGVVTDASGATRKDPEQELKDRTLISNLSTYGLNLDSPIYAADTTALDNYIKNIASSGSTAYANQFLYSPEQRAGLKNLGLIGQDQGLVEQAASPEIKSPFSVNPEDIAKSEFTANTANTISSMENTLNVGKGPEVIGQKTEYFNTGERAFSGGNRGTEWLNEDDTDGGSRQMRFESLLKRGSNRMTKPGAFITKAYELLGPNVLWSIYQNGDRGKFLGATTPYRVNFTMDRIKEAYDNKLAELNKLNNIYKSKTSLENYIKQSFGVDQKARDVSGRRPITQV